jgi:hypothetical protein
MFERIASGSAGLVPARTALLFCARVKIIPFESTCVFVVAIGSVIETTLKWRVGAPVGQIESLRPAYGSTVAPGDGAGAELPVSPSQGAPEWPFAENGGRSPMWGRISGHA